MNKILKTVKSGFDNVKELLGIFINDENVDEGYDRFTNSTNKELAQTAMLLQSLEYEQEEKRFSLFSTKEIKKHVKKNYKPITPSVPESSKVVSNDIQLEGLEPDK